MRCPICKKEVPLGELLKAPQVLPSMTNRSKRSAIEDLVERMKPRPVDKRVGVRDIDIANPGFGMPLVPVPARSYVQTREISERGPRRSNQVLVPAES